MTNNPSEKQNEQLAALLAAGKVSTLGEAIAEDTLKGYSKPKNPEQPDEPSVPSDAGDSTDDEEPGVYLSEFIRKNSGKGSEKALSLALNYGWIDGGHHKQWVIDQMCRALTGKHYEEFVKAFKAGEEGPETYEWDEGIAP